MYLSRVSSLSCKREMLGTWSIGTTLGKLHEWLPMPVSMKQRAEEGVWYHSSCHVLTTLLKLFMIRIDMLYFPPALTCLSYPFRYRFSKYFFRAWWCQYYCYHFLYSISGLECFPRDWGSPAFFSLNRLITSSSYSAQHYTAHLALRLSSSLPKEQSTMFLKNKAE